MKHAVVSRWSREQIYSSPDDYFRDLISAMDRATQSIELETYIFEKGVLATRVSEALCRATARGVDVRLLVDGVGSPSFMFDFEKHLCSHGVRVHYYRVLPWIFHTVPGEPNSQLGKFVYRIMRLNKGDHRKLCLIDQKMLWVGSANISDVHIREVNGAQAWKDLGVVVEGADVYLARRAFHRAFKRGLSLRVLERMPRLLAINQTFFQQRRRRAAQWRRLKRANERIWIQTPYFVPLTRVLRRLALKAKQGVDVRILVPKRSDVWFVKWISYSYLYALTKRGIRIYEYPDRFVHQKLYLMDDWICLGSTNLNHRSFLHDLEIDVVITLDENKKKLEEQFLCDQEFSLPFNTQVYEKLPIWKKLLGQILTLLAYWS